MGARWCECQLLVQLLKGGGGGCQLSLIVAVQVAVQVSINSSKQKSSCFLAFLGQMWCMILKAHKQSATYRF